MDQTLEPRSFHGVMECQKLSSEKDICYVCTFEEAIYKRNLSKSTASVLVRYAHPKMHETGALGCPSIMLVALQWPCNDLWIAVHMSVVTKMSASKYLERATSRRQNFYWVAQAKGVCLVAR